MDQENIKMNKSLSNNQGNIVNEIINKVQDAFCCC